MHDILIVLAGGMSSRMKKSVNGQGLTERDIDQANHRSKGLIALGEDQRPLLDFLLFNAAHAGYTDVIIVTGMDNTDFKACYGKQDADNDFHGLKISYAIQFVPGERIKPLGTADALYQAFQQYPRLHNCQFTVCNSDNLYSVTAFKALRNSSAANAWINYDRDGLDFPVEKIIGFAITAVNGQNELIDIIEKPSSELVNRYCDQGDVVRVSMNIFKLEGALIYPYLENCPLSKVRLEKELPNAILNMVKEHPGVMTGISLKEHVPDLTEKDDINRVRQYLQLNYQSIDWNRISG